jgi:transcriptional regulator
MGKSDVLHGTLDLLVFKALSLGPLHGYAIVQRISQFGEDTLRVEEGSLYPALYRLEADRWIASSWARTDTNRRARYYRLTPKGQRRLAREERHWREFIRVIGKVVESA